MTRTASSRPIQIDPPAVRLRRLDVIWDLSRVAAAALAKRHGVEKTDGRATGIAVTIESASEHDNRATCTISLVTESNTHVQIHAMDAVRVDWVVDREAGLNHIEASGVLSASIRRVEANEASPRVIYSRSPLLGTLGIGGGRYAIRSVSLEES